MAELTRDVLMIPCWRRPEFLWHCLDNLSRAEGVEQLHVLFRVDTGYDRAVFGVIEEFAAKFASHQIDVPVPCPYRSTKQSANVLGGYLLAAGQARRYVFMVEEDIMVARDFLRWHYAVQAAQPRLFCSIGVLNHNRNVPDSLDPQTYYLTMQDYCSWGVCFERSIIEQLIAPHVRREYFEDPGAYCAREFAGSGIGAAFVEQDGLIRRIQVAAGQGHPIAYPYRARAFHAGFIGYHRAGSLRGNLRARIREVGEVIYNADAMRKAAACSAFVHDSVPVPLDTPHWDAVRYQALPTTAETPG